MKHLINGKTVNIKHSKKDNQYTLTHSHGGLTVFLKDKNKESLIQQFKDALSLNKLIDKIVKP